MKAENSRPKMRPFHAARAVFPTGRDSPSDCLERYLETIAELEPDVGAFVNFNLISRGAARSTALARLDPLSLIDGMPVGIKDRRNHRHADRNGLAAVQAAPNVTRRGRGAA
jgi:Asp-tRNA(Asn)/Glu-tRNA(Gln) amidotransferase A subunit family amidase